MANNILGALFETNAGPGKAASAGKAETALETFRAKATETFQSVAEASRRAAPALGATTAELERLAVASKTAFDQMNRHVQGWSQTATTSLARVAEQVLRHISIEQQSAVESGRAEAQKTLLRKAAVQERAVIEAVKETAAGFASLGDFNFWGAAQHFASAALWGSLATLQIAGAVGAFGGGGHPSRQGASGGATPPAAQSPPGVGPMMASGVPASAGTTGGGGTVNVVIMGEPEGAQWLAGVLTKHVTQRGGKLVSSHAVRPVSAGA
jgi:hypothetical protein